MWKAIFPLLALLTVSCASTPATNDTAPEPVQEAAVSAADEVAAYPITTCPVSLEPLPEEGYETLQVGERELRFCCASCKMVAEKDPAQALAEFETAVMDHQRPDYPLDTCVVSGQGLDSMGGPKELLVGDTLVRVCCSGCIGAVSTDPEPYLAKIDDAR
ncbi:MAG: hypothetical protein AAFZ65_04050 [Planctomycetota bacterium]